MYTDVGNKIKNWAMCLGWCFLVGGVISWLYFMLNGSQGWYGYHFVEEDNFIGWICLASGGVLFCLTWIIYGFGQLIEDVQAIRNRLEDTNVNSDELPDL